MNTLELVFGIILLVFSVFLVFAVLMQSGKSKNLSGAIAGGAETFFGKEKGKTADKLLSKLTTIVSVIFVILVVAVYMINHDKAAVDPHDKYNNDDFAAADTTVADTTSAEEETTVADETSAEEETTAADETSAEEETTVADETSAEVETTVSDAE